MLYINPITAATTIPLQTKLDHVCVYFGLVLGLKDLCIIHLIKDRGKDHTFYRYEVT